MMERNKDLDQDLINQLLLYDFGDRDDIINAMRLSSDQDDVDEIIDILQSIQRHKRHHDVDVLSSSEFYEDEQLISLQNDLQSKRKLLRSVRGCIRMKENKFSTIITSSFVPSILY